MTHFRNLLTAIAAQKTEILTFLKAAKIPANAVELSIIPVSRDQDLPLSFAQQRLWFLHQLSPDSHSYNLLEALRLEGPLNLVALKQSLNELIRRHEVLRTTFPLVVRKTDPAHCSPLSRQLTPSRFTGVIDSGTNRSLSRSCDRRLIKAFRSGRGIISTIYVT